jgi:hypothetical protein
MGLVCRSTTVTGRKTLAPRGSGGGMRFGQRPGRAEERERMAAERKLIAQERARIAEEREGRRSAREVVSSRG